MILFITLFFIMSLSILVLINLSDTSSYLLERNSKFTKSQLLYSVNNVKNEIIKILDTTENRENLYKYLDIDFPLDLKDMKLIIRLSEYDKYDINVLNKNESEYIHFKDYLNSVGIYDFYTLQESYSDFNNIENTKQLETLLTKFNQKSYTENIFIAKEHIGFIKEYVKKDFNLKNEDKDIKFYELFITIEYLNHIIKAYYILDKEGIRLKGEGVKYFEYRFK